MNRRKFLKATSAICTGAAVSLGRPKKARSANTQVKVLMTGVPPDPSTHYLYYAQYNGFFKGIDVSFSMFNAETTVTRALVAGDGDVAWTGIVSTMQAIAAGAKLKCITGITPKTDWVVIARKDISNLKDLEGRSFAVSGLGAAAHVGPQLLLEQFKVDTRRVKWVAIGGSSARVQVLLADKVEATALTPAFAVEALRNSNFHQIGDLAKDLPKFAFAVDIASTEAIEKKREALFAYVSGAARGAKWAMENPKEAAEASRKVMPNVSLELLLAATEAHAKTNFFNLDVVYPREDFDFMYESAIRLGRLKPGLKYEEFYFPDFALAAKAQMK